MSPSDLKPLLARVAAGHALDRDEARVAFDIIMAGEATSAQIAGLLMALRVRGETVEELVGAVGAMRGKVNAVIAPEDSVDIVGTGGDGSGSLNVSTAAAIVAAGAGAKVAKHGNRALSSRSGAADVLAALGVRIDIAPEQVETVLNAAGIAFMMAPAHHPAMRHVGPTRIELGTRTIFNLIGPLANPAGVRRHMIGVFAPEWLEPFAQVLAAFGSRHAWIVHGDGLDEITVTGPSDVVELKDQEIRRFVVRPEAVGLALHDAAALQGGDAEENATAIRALLGGAAGAYRDIVLMNAGAGLVVAGRAPDLAEGVRLAARSIDTGAASAALERLVQATNS